MNKWEKIIRKHNDVVTAIRESALPVPEDKIFKSMEIWRALSLEGLAIVQQAREDGVNVVVNMQDGEISYK